MELHERLLDSICYKNTSSVCSISGCYRFGMDSAELAAFRVERLKALIAKLGSKAALARKVEFSANGGASYVNQWLNGKRPISEKTIEKIEEKLELPGWFSPGIKYETARPPAIGKALTPTAAATILVDALKNQDEAVRESAASLLAAAIKRPEDAEHLLQRLDGLLKEPAHSH